MRPIALLLAGFALSACATGPTVERARMPLELVRAEGQSPRMGEVHVFAGGYEEDSPFAFSIYFDPEGDDLGKPDSVGWTVKLGDYCKNRQSWVQSVVVGPEGQVWKGFRVEVPAGPDRHQDWSSGSSAAEGEGAVATPGLLQAVTAGGRFTIALEDDEGHRWHARQIDTLSPDERQQLFAENLAAFRATDPAAVPVRSGLLRVVSPAYPALPSPPRRCPD